MILGRASLATMGLVLPLFSVVFLSGCEIKSVSNKTEKTAVIGGATPADSGDASKARDASDKTADASKVIDAEGSSTVYPICQAFAVEFEKSSKYKVSVGRQGTNGGYKKLLYRQADIWNASRPAEPKEVNDLKQKGIECLELNIAVDGIVIVVHSDNDWCSNLTCAQLKQIWEPDSKIKTWKDLDPGWPSEPMQLYGADTDSGTFDYFTEVINDKKKATNTKYNPASDDNILVQGVAGNKFALGYIPFGYYIQNTDKLKALGVSPTKSTDGTVAAHVLPTVDTILSGEYAPLSRPLFMYVNKDALKRPEVVEFLKFAISESSQPLIEKRGFVRVKEEARLQAVKRLEVALSESSAPKSF